MDYCTKLLYPDKIEVEMKCRLGGWVSHDNPMITIEDGTFWIHPVDFTKKVIETIQNDFKTFEGLVDSQSQLPTSKKKGSKKKGTG